MKIKTLKELVKDTAVVGTYTAVAADATLLIAKLADHNVMSEGYEQNIGYLGTAAACYAGIGVLQLCYNGLKAGFREPQRREGNKLSARVSGVFPSQDL